MMSKNYIKILFTVLLLVYAEMLSASSVPIDKSENDRKTSEIEEFQKQVNRNKELIKLGRWRETNYLYGSDRTKSNFSPSALASANSKLQEFANSNSESELATYVLFTYNVYGDESSSANKTFSEKRIATNNQIMEKAKLSGAMIGINIAEKLNYNPSNGELEWVNRSYETKLVLSEDLSTCIDLSYGSSSFKQNSDKALLHYVNTIVDELSKCIEEDGESALEDENEIIIVYDGVEYRNTDEIYIYEETDEIILEAQSSSVAVANALWEGAEGNGNQATLNIADKEEGEFEEVKVKVGAIETNVKIIKGNKVIRLTAVNDFFAPTVESVDVEYEIKSDKIQYAKLEVFKNGDTQNPVYEDNTLSVTGENLKVSWGGQMNQGNDQGKYISIFDSPYTIKITVSEDAEYLESFSASDITKVEIESLTLTPNGKEKLYKPSRTAVEIDKDIEAQVLIKNKQKNGVPTSLPLTIHWSFEDPDDIANDMYNIIDTNGNLDNDNTPTNQGGKTSPISIMWKTVSGFTSRVNFNTAESDVNIFGQDLGKTKLQFSSSAVGGDNYILVAQIKDANGTVIEEEKTKEWVVRKAHSFTRIYEMAGSHNMTQMMGTNNIDPAYSVDGCTDYALNAGAVNNLGANASPEFVVPLSPPIPLNDPVTGLSNANTETPTAQELQDYASNTAAIQTVAQTAITAKAQAWFNRVNSGLVAGKNTYLQQAGIQTPAIIGARYYHPKLDGRANNTNYYPAGIIINVANGNNAATMKDPDDDWRKVQGFRDGQDNAWIFLNIQSTLRKQVVARHEIGHTSDHTNFDNGNGTDHAASGLMQESGDIKGSQPDGDPNFSDDSIIKLRGRQ